MTPDTPALDRLGDVPVEEAAALRKVYGDQLDREIGSDDEIDNDEPQEHQ